MRNAILTISSAAKTATRAMAATRTAPIKRFLLRMRFLPFH